MDYISREAALNFEMSVECSPDEIQGVTDGMALYAEYIKQLPEADVVEVVRCKDCKYSDTFSDECEPTEFPLKCLSIRYGGVYQDWFCEHGRRREDGDADDKR